MPAACQGLSKAQINAAAASAINMVVGGRSKKLAWRRRAAEVAPRLAYLITGPQPVSSSPPQTYQPAAQTPVRDGTGSNAVRLAALGAWLITAGSGAYLLASWIISSGIRRRRWPLATGAPPAVVLGHFGLATTGLVVWVIYLVADWTPLAWTAVALLLLVAGLGLALATLGLPGRLSGAVDAPARADTAAPSARGWVRALLVAGHGLLATATLLLVVLAAIGAKAG